MCYLVVGSSDVRQLDLKARALDTQGDPFRTQAPEALVVGGLTTNLFDAFSANIVVAALQLKGEADGSSRAAWARALTSL
jgi:hypothetical protein